MRHSANRLINTAMTRRIAQLHDQGYCNDFALTPLLQVLCVQDNSCYHQQQISVKLIDQAYDHLLKQFCYLHTVETETGERGLLMLESIFFNDTSARTVS